MISNSAAVAGAPGRRADLDWVRIGAFAVLICYHIALFYAPWDWHVNSRHHAPWVAALLVVSNPWRLSLLFFVSGAATGFMSRRRSPGRLVAERSRRLLPPLLFGIFVLVPPQAYLEAVEKLGESDGYFDFWLQFLTIDHGLCLLGRCAAVPLNHLWFIPYIWTYSLLVALLLVVPALVGWLGRALGRALEGAGLLVVPILYLAVVRLTLFPEFGVTNRLMSDWYNHAASFPLFLTGFLMARHDMFWEAVGEWRWRALAMTIISCVPFMVEATQLDSGPASGIGIRAVLFAINQWTAIVAILGFGYRHLRHADGPLLRYLSAGVLPFYLVHQTVIVIAAFYLDRVALPVVVELFLILLATLIVCLASYELARRSSLLRPLFGLSPARRGQGPAATGEAMVQRVG